MRTQTGKREAKEKVYKNLGKAKWEDFKKELARSPLLAIEADGSNLDACAAGLEKLINRAMEVACPIKRALDRVPHPWWTLELTEMREEVKRLKDRAENLEAARLEYLDSKHNYRRTIRKERTESRRDFCSQAKSAKEISKNMQILRPKNTHGVGLFF